MFPTKEKMGSGCVYKFNMDEQEDFDFVKFGNYFSFMPENFSHKLTRKCIFTKEI